MTMRPAEIVATIKPASSLDRLMALAGALMRVEPYKLESFSPSRRNSWGAPTASCFNAGWQRAVKA
jgi:hypothetical protein